MYEVKRKFWYGVLNVNFDYLGFEVRGLRELLFSLVLDWIYS